MEKLLLLLKLLNKIINLKVRQSIFVLLLGLFISVFQGCGSLILYPFYGIEKPHKDSPNFCNQLLIKNGFDTTHSFFINPKYIDSLATTKYALNTYKSSKGIENSVIQLRMYNNSGIFIYGWEQCLGDLRKSNILDSLPFKPRPSFNNVINYNLNLNQDLSIISLNNERRQLLNEEIKAHEFIINVYYAGWVGWFTKDTFRQLKKYKIKYADKKILFLFINIS